MVVVKKNHEFMLLCACAWQKINMKWPELINFVYGILFSETILFVTGYFSGPKAMHEIEINLS